MRVIGSIKLGQMVMVSDPCYGMDVWCQGVLDNVLPGEYVCYIDIWDEGDWGNRVAMIEVIHSNYRREADNIEYTPESFEVGVDSGQAGIFDYEYYEHSHNTEAMHGSIFDDWYDEVCRMTISNRQGGTIDNAGLVSSSGYGDGGYTCLTWKDKDGYISAIRIEFLDEDEDDY